MPQIVWTAGPDGQIDYLNRRWTEFTGLPDAVRNDAWGPLLHPEEAVAAGQRWAASVGTGALFEMELRLLDRRQQTYRWHLLRTIAVEDEAGQVTRWYGTATDIHEQKRAEEASRYLAAASAALAGVVDYESTLQKVANLAVPHFAVLRTGEPEVVAEITDDLLMTAARDERQLERIRSLGLKSYICVPLIVSGHTFGALTFATAESGRRYTDPTSPWPRTWRTAPQSPSRTPSSTTPCGSRTGGRTSSWRRWPTSCATRWLRSETRCRSSGCPGWRRPRPSAPGTCWTGRCTTWCGWWTTCWTCRG
jgi:PAS domain S-box-containing protein